MLRDNQAYALVHMDVEPHRMRVPLEQLHELLELTSKNICQERYN